MLPLNNNIPDWRIAHSPSLSLNHRTHTPSDSNIPDWRIAHFPSLSLHHRTHTPSDSNIPDWRIAHSPTVPLTHGTHLQTVTLRTIWLIAFTLCFSPLSSKLTVLIYVFSACWVTSLCVFYSYIFILHQPLTQTMGSLTCIYEISCMCIRMGDLGL